LITTLTHPALSLRFDEPRRRRKTPVCRIMVIATGFFTHWAAEWQQLVDSGLSGFGRHSP